MLQGTLNMKWLTQKHLQHKTTKTNNTAHWKMAVYLKLSLAVVTNYKQETVQLVMDGLGINKHHNFCGLQDCLACRQAQCKCECG